MPDTRRSYPAAMIFLHWAMLLLLVGVYGAIELREFFPKGSDIREGFKAWHFMLGLSVLTLALVRVAVRVSHRAPPITPQPPALQQWASKAVHLALYGLMIGMPLAGWAILSARGAPVPFFGLELPPILPSNKPLAGQIKEIHETAGTIGYWLIGLHAAAALAHHYLWKDDTLRRMLPGKRSQG